MSPQLGLGRSRRLLGNTLRVQFTLVIFMLAFLPNLILMVKMPDLLFTPPTVMWMLVVAAVCGLIGYVLSAALLQPLSRLQAEVTQSNFTEPHYDDPNEIQALRGAFSGLIDRLGTEQARRNAFMATLVHDLKTPLIATGHLTKTLTTMPLPAAERQEVGQHIQAETERLLALVQQMADAHRFERDDVRLNTGPVQLRALAETIARRLCPQLEARGLHLSVSGEGIVTADANALERAVMNLTENALRYASERLELEVFAHGIIIRDDGPGLSGSLEELAQPFNGQAATIAGQKYMAGTAGLGLFIARRIAEAHHGALLYQRLEGSPSQTQFTLQLPEVET